jgi:hypothetical protein
LFLWRLLIVSNLKLLRKKELKLLFKNYEINGGFRRSAWKIVVIKCDKVFEKIVMYLIKRAVRDFSSTGAISMSQVQRQGYDMDNLGIQTQFQA